MVKTEPEEQLVHLDQLQKQVLQDPKDHKVTMAHQALQVILEQQVGQVTSEPLVQPDLQDKLVMSEQPVFVVLKDLQVQKG